MICPLQRPVRHYERAGACHPMRETPDRRGGNLTKLRCPIRVLGTTVSAPEQVIAKLVESDTIPREKLLIMQSFSDERVGESQHQRGVGVGTRCHPLGIQKA